MKRFVCFFLILILSLSIAGCNSAGEKEETQFPPNWEMLQLMLLKPMDEVMDALQITEDQLKEIAPMHVRVLDYDVEYAGATFELEMNPSRMPDEEDKEKYNQYDYSELPVPEYPEEEFLLTFLYKAKCDNLEEAMALMGKVVANYTELLGKPDSGNYLDKDPQDYFKEAETSGITSGLYELKVVWDCTPDNIHFLEYTTEISIAPLYNETGETTIGYQVSISAGCRMRPQLKS